MSALLALAAAPWADEARGEESSAATSNGVRLVGCDEPVQSRKRGIGANRLSKADFRALAPGVSWYYNWAVEPGGTGEPPADAPMEFIPMAWGPGEGTRRALEKYLATKGVRPRVVLALNEPNLVEANVAAGMTPEASAKMYSEIKDIAARRGIRVIGPQMSIGSPPHMSVKAHDPLEGREVTYTYMVPFLDAFFHFANRAGVAVDGLGMHPYMNAAGLEGLMDMAAEKYGKPIWVTEFSNSEEPRYDMPYKLRDLVQAVDYLERAPHIEAYAYFKERNAVHAPLGLFTEKDGQLNVLGEAYVRMPVHDPAIHYRLPGRLEAEKYTTQSGLTIWPTTDEDGFLHMRTEREGAALVYQVHVAEAGVHRVRARVTGAAGELTMRRGERTIGRVTATPPRGEWQTVEFDVALEAGAQALRCEFSAQPFGINWLEFQPKR